MASRAAATRKQFPLLATNKTYGSGPLPVPAGNDRRITLAPDGDKDVRRAQREKATAPKAAQPNQPGTCALKLFYPAQRPGTRRCLHTNCPSTRPWSFPHSLSEPLTLATPALLPARCASIGHGATAPSPRPHLALVHPRNDPQAAQEVVEDGHAGGAQLGRHGSVARHLQQLRQQRLGDLPWEKEVHGGGGGRWEGGTHRTEGPGKGPCEARQVVSFLAS